MNATSKLVKAWESKNAKNAAKAGGVSLMALSLAACGGSSTTTTTSTDTSTDSTTTTPVVAGKIVAATTGADVFSPNATAAASTLGAGDDTIYATTNDSLNNGDVFDGGAGADALVANLSTSATVAPTMSNVETVTITNNSTGAAGASYTLNAINVDGMTSLTFKDTADTAVDTHIATNLDTGVELGINNSEGTAHIYTFSYTGLTGTADNVVLNTTSIGTATGVVRITDATATATANTGLETLTINNTAAASTIGTLDLDDSGNAASVNTVVVNASAAFTVSNSIDFEGTTSGTINASGSTAAVTLVATGGEAITFTGGSGNDSITTGAGNDVLSGGAGNDTFTIGTGDDSVTGGAGNDVVVGADAAIVLSGVNKDTLVLGEGTRDEVRFNDVTAISDAGVTLTAAQIGALTDIEVIGSSAAVTAIDANYWTQNTFHLTGALTAAVTMSDVQTGDTLIISGGLSAVNGDGFTFTGASAAQSVTVELDNADVQVTDGGAGNAALVFSSNISTVNLVSTNTGTGTATNVIDHAARTIATHAIDNASAGSFVASGGSALTITAGATAGFTQAVNFDGSAMTAALVIDGSESNDVIKGGSAADTINGYDGDDVLTGGGGADTFEFVSQDMSGAPSTVIFEKITDFNTGGSDKIDWDTALTIDTASAAASATVAQVSSEGFATFHASDDTLAEKIVASAKGFDADGDFAIFEHGSDSYILISGDANATQDVADTLIMLDGVTGLSDVTIDGSGDMTIA